MRVLWVLAMLALCVVFGLLCLANLYSIYAILTGGQLIYAIGLPRAIFWSVFWFVLSGGAAAFARMKPSEAREAVKEPEAPRAAWLDELNQPPKQD